MGLRPRQGDKILLVVLLLIVVVVAVVVEEHSCKNFILDQLNLTSNDNQKKTSFTKIKRDLNRFVSLLCR